MARKAKKTVIWPVEVTELVTAPAIEIENAKPVSFGDACVQIMRQAWKHASEDQVTFCGRFFPPSSYHDSQMEFRIHREWHEREQTYVLEEGEESWGLQNCLDWMQRIVDGIQAARERETRRKELIERLTPEERELLGVKV